eukprot:m.95325 g.95325  ORF g.95325 m.95325 type:complete len:103 (+) comp12326_c0_seq4:873-1181(+)
MVISQLLSLLSSDRNRTPKMTPRLEAHVMALPFCTSFNVIPMTASRRLGAPREYCSLTTSDVQMVTTTTSPRGGRQVEGSASFRPQGNSRVLSEPAAPYCQP